MKQEKLFERGSEWRKWDLHLHTPASFDYKNKNITAKEIAEKLKEKDISVVAITDHHIIDEKWISDIRNESDKINHKITIFPGMEIRTELEAKENIHIIAIFKESSNINYINTELTTKLDINSQLENGELEEKIYCKYDKTIEVIKSLDGVISIHCAKKSNGIDDVISNNTPVKQKIKEKMIKEIDICEIGQYNDIESYKKYVFTDPNINKIYPIILCSDNHNISEYYKDENIFTWIKADPTFNGLKQILYEPEERVKIQEEKPDKKEDYNIIESILLKNKDGLLDEQKILDKDIEIKLNQNLNSIIGEKSSGKSFLLFLIARTLLSKQEFDKISNVFKKENQKEKKYEFKYEELFRKINCTIRYKSDQLYELKDNLNDRKITYIPQGYLNQSVEEDEELMKNIEKDIIDIFETKNLDLRKLKDDYTNFLNENQEKLNNNIDNYFINNDKIEKLKKELTDYGVQKQEIEKIKKRKEEELKQIIMEFKDIDKKEIELYKKTEQTITALEYNKNAFNKSLNKLDNINYNSLKPYFENLEKQILDNIGSGILYNCLDEIYKDSEEQFNKNKEKQKIFFKIKILKIDGNILKEEYKIKAIKEKIKKQGDLNSKKTNVEKEINDINLKIIKLTETEELISKAKEEKGVIWNLIIEDFNKYLEEIFSFCEKCNSYLLKVKKSIDGVNELNMEPKFNQKLYQGQFENVFDMRGGKVTNDAYNFNDIELVNYKNHFLKLFNNEYGLRYKDNKSQKDILKNLCINLLSPKLIIKYDDDIFDEKMSAGKRAILLLKILIEVNTEDKTPILIDQPEDDLDSKSVYKHLVDYIKTAKKRRQIILVSHNPNIVVGCDSEEVIIAQQKNKKFYYRSGSLENSYLTDKNSNITPETAGIRENVCDILEGGTEAFKKREQKYNINNKK